MIVAVMFDLPSWTCLVVAGLAVSRFVVAGIVVLVLAFLFEMLWFEKLQMFCEKCDGCTGAVFETFSYV